LTVDPPDAVTRKEATAPSAPISPTETTPLPPPPRPSIRERLGRRPFGVGFWVGIGILAVYLGAALSALVVFSRDLSLLSVNENWVPSAAFTAPIGPTYSHPFGVLPGLGVDLFDSLWQASPWDLGIVAGVLGFDVLLGWVLGSLAGMNEGGTLDALISWVGDTLGAIPSFFLVVGFFAALSFAAPSDIGIPLFVLLFGVIIWPATARLTRDRARLVARQPYVEATRASGGSRARILVKHILPGSISSVFAQLPLDMAPIFFVLIVFPWFWDCGSSGAKMHEGSIVGYLIPSLPPFSPLPSVNFPEWGNLLAVGVCEGLPISTGLVSGTIYWWMFVFPLAAIMGLAFGLALVCDALDRRLSALPR
jgi:peptide/nickel transport system permease protein